LTPEAVERDARSYVDFLAQQYAVKKGPFGAVGLCFGGAVVLRMAAHKARGWHIRVNAINPGHIDTPIFGGWQQGDALIKMKEDLAKNVPLGRMGDPDEIANLVTFLASDEASYVSGVELFVDGGVAQI
jgi:NAD(P)-dependent dehydrogenase (short-subunit alcohol dehydrogenase family)